MSKKIKEFLHKIGIIIKSRNSFSTVSKDTMKIITSQAEFENTKSRDLIKLECKYCNNIFTKEKHYVQARKGDFCSTKCSVSFRSVGKFIIKSCSQCGKEVRRVNSQLKKNKSKNLFCNGSCAAIYNNTNKTTGTRRAKLEKWLESQLNILYPNLEIKFNHILPNCCELDIFVPSLALAFELNGIFHYEPIFGQEKLDRTKNNDIRKFKHCRDNNIGLCVIDTTKQKRFSPENSKEFLDIITNIISKESL